MSFDKNRISKKKSQKPSNEVTSRRFITDKKSILIVAYVIYITFIILVRMPNLAEEVLDTQLQDSLEYRLNIYEDGWNEHCYVKRHNISNFGLIDVKYTRSTNTMEVTCSNIRVLLIDCRSMFEEYSKKIFGVSSKDNSNYYKWYFIEKDHLNVNVDTDKNLTNLTFKDTPLPYEVRVNGEIWIEDLKYFFDPDNGIVITDVPEGHNNVDIYFKSPKSFVPKAIIISEREIYYNTEIIKLSGSESYDPDNQKLQYFWDMGDGTFFTGKKEIEHNYPIEGIYGVILTVRDEDLLVSHAYLNLTILNGSKPSFRGLIPDQIHEEDCEPWELNLSKYEPNGNLSDKNFKWYITGEDENLYSVRGENSSDDKLIFSPVKNAYGNDQIRIWASEVSGLTLYQDLWVNLTPVNDPPYFIGAPDLVIQYDVPYTFDYEPYINDVDTPKDQLILTTTDDTHTSVKGFNVTYRYPLDYVNKDNIFVILTVSDSENEGQDLIEIIVIDGIIPELIKKLPDVSLYEGTTLYHAFNLNDHFTSADNSISFFIINSNHITTIIHENASVSLKAPHDWVGSEHITIRAKSHSGAFVEDTFTVTVLPKNDPPVILDIPEIVVHHDLNYYLNLKPYISDEDDPLDQLRISTSDSTNIQFDNNDKFQLILNYPWRNTLPYRESATLTVFDEASSVSKEIQILVTTNHPPKLIKTIPDITFYEDEILEDTFNIFDFFIDEDGDELSYNLISDNILWEISEDGNIILGAPPNWNGDDYIKVIVRDNNELSGFCQTNFYVYVIPVNDAPVLEEIPSINLNTSETAKLKLIPYISDIDNEIYELTVFLNESNIDAEIFGFDLVVYGNKSLTGKLDVFLTDGDKNSNQIIPVLIKGKTSVAADYSFLIQIIIIILILMLVSIGIFSYRRYYGNYTIVESFLIYENGCLINHSMSNTSGRKTEEVDIVGSMFTAVQDFIQDSFSNGETDDKNWSLKRMEFGDNNIFIERGKYVFLAIIFKGVSGKKLISDAEVIIKDIEQKYKPVLKDWNGDLSAFDDLKIKLK